MRREEKTMAIKKGAWSPDEDQKLITYIKKYGIWMWSEMPKAAGLLRSGKSCRLRWMNYLRPEIKHGNFTREEEETIFRIHKMLGNKWSTIAAALPGRTDNEIKNHWNTYLKKRLIRSQVSSGESNENNLPKIDPKASFLDDGSKNIPVLTQKLISHCSSQDQPAVGMINENQNIEPIGSETFGEATSFWRKPLNLYEENLEDTFVDPSGFKVPHSETSGEVVLGFWGQPLNIFEENEINLVDDSGFVVPHYELWYPEPIFSPYGFYNDGFSSDLWFDFNLPVPDDDSETNAIFQVTS